MSNNINSLITNVSDIDDNIFPLKTLVIGDPHFTTHNVKECQLLTNSLINLAKNIKPDIIIFVGDLLNDHEKIHVVPHTNCIKMLLDISKIAKTFVIIGNHDRPNNSDFLSDYHPFNGLSSDQIFIIDKVRIFNFIKSNDNCIITDVELINDDITSSYMLNNYKFVFVPYVPNGKFKDALLTKQHFLNNIYCMFAHQEFLGAKYNGIISQTGDNIDTNHLIISGHIHEYGYTMGGYVRYIGSPHQTNFGESSDKTVSEFTFYPPYYNNCNQIGITKFNENRISLNLPKRITIKIKANEFETFEPTPGDIIRLIIEATKGESKIIRKSIHLKNIQEKAKIQINFDYIDDNILNTNNNLTLSFNEDRRNFLDKFKDKLTNDSTKLLLLEKIMANK